MRWQKGLKLICHFPPPSPVHLALGLQTALSCLGPLFAAVSWTLPGEAGVGAGRAGGDRLSQARTLPILPASLRGGS